MIAYLGAEVKRKMSWGRRPAPLPGRLPTHEVEVLSIPWVGGANLHGPEEPVEVPEKFNLALQFG